MNYLGFFSHVRRGISCSRHLVSTNTNPNLRTVVVDACIGCHDAVVGTECARVAQAKMSLVSYSQSFVSQWWTQYTHFEKLPSGEILELEILLECRIVGLPECQRSIIWFGRMPKFPHELLYIQNTLISFHYISFTMLKFSRTTSWEIWI